MNEHAEPRADIRSIEHVWIPMPDGVRLAARIWMPAQVPPNGVPGIFEYIPYRKADLVRARDERNHPWLAQNGYVSLRVDMRGSGDSEGHMADMYSDDELSDARHVIDWIAQQRWCNGRVGMFGTSWGGTASLQASVDAPKALKAAIAVCATHDRYEDDIHHMGGCLLTDTFEWGATLPAILALPPTRAVGDDWMDRWKARLDNLSFPVETWVREEARGTYWRHGSMGTQADRFGCPVLAVGGWSDRYSNSVMSLVDAAPDKVWGIVGPWGHHYPDKGHPGPSIGFQHVALDWWDHWLKHDGVAPPDWPRLRVWLREFDPPKDAIDARNGAWVQSAATGQVTQERKYFLESGNALSEAKTPCGPWVIRSDLRHGAASGDTGYFGRFGGLPLDQNDDDARSLVFETPPLDEDLILYGGAELAVTVESPPDRGQLCVRLNDVSPEDVSARVCFGMRNLALDDNLDDPGQETRPDARAVRVKFPTQAYRFQRGHRIRLTISSSYWPLVWTAPSSEPIQITDGALTLPLAQRLQALQRPWPSATQPLFAPNCEMRAAPELERTPHDEQDGTCHASWYQPLTTTYYPETDTELSSETEARFGIAPEDPASAESEFRQRFVLRRPDGEASVTSILRASCGPTTFDLVGHISVTWSGEESFTRDWSVRAPRRLS